MPTSYTSLLGLALPVTGELSGTWGDTVNDYITQYLDAAVAGAQTISGSQTAVTLSKTTASSLTQAGSGSTGSSQYQIINCTGNPAGLLTITVPAASKAYLVLNSTSTSQSVKVVGAGPTTGVTMVSGEKALIAWDGSDFVKVASSTADGVTTLSFGTTGLTPNSATAGAITVAGTLVAANGGTGQSSYTTGDLLYATGSTALSKLGIGTNGQVLTSTGTAPQWSTLSGVAVTTFSAGTTGLTPNTPTSGAITLGGTLATTNGGTGLTSFSANQVFYASSTSAFAQSSNLQFSGTDLTVYGITVGRGAGAVSTNTAVGASALAANTSGIENNAFGNSALLSNTTGGSNVAFGTNALRTNITGSENTALGHQVLYASTGSFNTGAGTNTLRFNTSGASNTAFGHNSLFSNTTASNNTAVGYQAAYSNTTGTSIDAFGRFSLYGNTTGNYNVGLGSASLQNNSNGSNNTAVGYQALLSNTAASNNTAVGYQAGYLNTTGNGLALFGYQAGYSNSTGTNNTAIGFSALASNTTASGNTAVGYYSLLLNTTGAANVAVGENSLRSNTTGGNNTVLGYQALFSNTTASSNTAVGYQAGYANTTGIYNTFLGSLAGFTSTTGSNNLHVGFAAGYNSTGSRNTFVGARNGSSGSGQYMTSGNANTILGGFDGNQGGLDIRTSNGNIVLSDGDGNPQMYYVGGNWNDAAGKLRAIPQSGSAKTTSYTLATTDVGEYIQVGSGGSITIPDATFATGDVVSIFNNTTGNITITCSITTAYIAGTDSDKATMTLATRGVATVLFISSTVCVVTGNVT